MLKRPMPTRKRPMPIRKPATSSRKNLRRCDSPARRPWNGLRAPGRPIWRRGSGRA